MPTKRVSNAHATSGDVFTMYSRSSSAFFFFFSRSFCSCSIAAFTLRLNASFSSTEASASGARPFREKYARVESLMCADCFRCGGGAVDDECASSSTTPESGLEASAAIDG